MIKKILSIFIPVLIAVLSLSLSLISYLRYREIYVQVPVASHQLYQRSLLSKEDLSYIEVPKAFIQEDVLIDEDEILGQYVKLSYTVPKGSLIYKGALEKEIGDLALTLLQYGEVSYDLYTGEVKVNTGNLNVGNNVDIYLTIKTNEKTLSDVLLEDCRVIGLYDSQGRQIRSYETDARIAIVSIAVEKSHVNLLNKALMVGSVSVLMSDGTYEVNARAKANEEAEVFSYLQ